MLANLQSHHYTLDSPIALTTLRAWSHFSTNVLNRHRRANIC